MAWGGYGKNSPDYTTTERPFTGVANNTSATPVPATRARTGAQEFCCSCGKKVADNFLVCPYCRFDLEAARVGREKSECSKCGAGRSGGAVHCHACGKKH